MLVIIEYLCSVQAPKMKQIFIAVWMASFIVLQVNSQTLVTLPSTDPATGQVLTLEDYLCGGEDGHFESNTILQLSSDSAHYFNSNGYCIVSNISNITIRGDPSSQQPSLVICNDTTSNITQTGFGFVNISDIMIENIHFQHCGGIIPCTMKDIAALLLGPRQQAMLFFVNCFNVGFNNVAITRYTGYAVIAFNALGRFELQDVEVSKSIANINNLTQTTSDFIWSGSGVLIFYKEVEDSFLGDLNNTTIAITSTNFTANTNLFPLDTQETAGFTATDFTLRSAPLTGAGGLTIIHTQQTYSVTIILNSSKIVGNSGTVMGGVLLGHIQSVGITDMHIDNCVFAKNLVFPNHIFPLGGSALQIAFLFPFPQALHGNMSSNEKLAISNTCFFKNRGNAGSAVNVYSGAQNITKVNVTLYNVTFLQNEAQNTGDCMFVYSDKSIFFTQTEIPVFMDHITYLGAENNANPHGTTSVFAFQNVPLVFISGTDERPTVFRDGRHSVIQAFASNVYITGTVFFENNMAIDGPAIALIANSYLFFKEPAHVHFINNKATVFGGAIYTEALSNDQCAVQFTCTNGSLIIRDLEQVSSLDIRISFSNNAAFVGNSLYVAPLYNCSWFIESVVQTSRGISELVYQHLFNFTHENETFANQVRSAPQTPCFCSTDNDNEGSICVEEFTVNATYPGRTFSLPFIPVDAARRSVSSLVITQLLGDTGLEFLGDNQTAIADLLGGNECSVQRYTLFNQENTTVNMQVDVASTSSSSSINTTIEILPCPIGFQFDSNTGICECGPLYQMLELECDIQTGWITRDKLQWIGLAFVDTDPTPAYAILCPPDYCNKSVRSVDLLQNDSLCQNDRKGAICGQCRDGLSTQFGSTTCSDCSNYWLFTILLYLLAGILLVFLLFFLRLTITEGTIIGLIFYAQVISINDGLLLLTDRSNVLTVFFSLLNLDLGFPLCFYDGMDFTAKVGLQFVFPVYIWLIVLSIIFLGRFSRHFQDSMMGQTAVHVLVTLLYLTFAKLLRSVLIIFIGTRLFTENGDLLVWFYDGSVEFAKGRHLVLVIVAIVTLVFFIIPYKTFLLFVQLFIRIPKVNTYFKPLIDAAVAPFKDKYRFWFGLRLFVIGITVILNVSLAAHSPSSSLFVQLLIGFPYTVVQAYIQPYQRCCINLLDLFFLVNYNIFLFTRLYFTDAPHITVENFQRNFIPVQGIFLGSAFVVSIGIFISHVKCYTIPHLKKTCRTKRKVDHVVTTSEISLDQSIPFEMHRMDTQTTDTSDLNFWTAGHRLRESLLEDVTEN